MMLWGSIIILRSIIESAGEYIPATWCQSCPCRCRSILHTGVSTTHLYQVCIRSLLGKHIHTRYIPANTSQAFSKRAGLSVEHACQHKKNTRGSSRPDPRESRMSRIIQNLAGRVRSGQVALITSRVGSGRVGLGLDKTFLGKRASESSRSLKSH